MSKQYETVIGLEVHVELKTDTKIFCSCEVEFGGDPNTHICPVCMGLPGSLPTLNEKVVEFAIRAGLSLDCDITRLGKQDRKNYFYPDSPKAYQISQDEKPLCHSGHLDIENEDEKKRIGITRIHIEEDAGKLIHDPVIGTLIDYNRAGVPLIEIVTEPDFRSEVEVKAFLQKLRTTLIYIDVSDAKMNEGSFRCDVNLSIREKGEEKLGTRAEIKNLNSFNSISRAIDYERKRQIKMLEKGETIVQETRGYDDEKRSTYSMREKEDATDYRYFPDPDLMPIRVDDETINRIKRSIPELPEARKQEYIEKYGLSGYDSEQIISSKETADYFEECAEFVFSPKTLANILIGEIFSLLPIDEFSPSISPERLAELINFIEDGTVNNNSAKKIIKIMNETQKTSEEIIRENSLQQINSREELEPVIDKIIKISQKAVEEYKGGKEKALQSIIGSVMRETKGLANPELSKAILKEKMKGN